jgi:hypothetical protein
VLYLERNNFRVIGKVIDANLDGEGNLNLTLRNSNEFWAETAVKRLRELKGQVLKFDIAEWTQK